RRQRHPSRGAAAWHLSGVRHRRADQYRRGWPCFDRAHLGRRQRQGDRPHPRESRRPCRRDDRHLSGPRVVRHGREHQPGEWRGILHPAGPECERQLGQGGATHPRAHPRRAQAGRPDPARRHERHRRDRHRQSALGPRPVLIDRVMTAIPAFERPAVPHRAIVSVCSMIATLMQALDNTIANVALPYMQGTLSTTLDQITWVLTSYVIAAAIMTAPVGWLAARFGLKNLFLACLGGFTVTSMLCGLAESLPQMVVFRLLQGMFGAALVPLSQSTMF